jgi:hypothetical protein
MDTLTTGWIPPGKHKATSKGRVIGFHFIPGRIAPIITPTVNPIAPPEIPNIADPRSSSIPQASGLLHSSSPRANPIPTPNRPPMKPPIIPFLSIATPRPCGAALSMLSMLEMLIVIGDRLSWSWTNSVSPLKSTKINSPFKMLLFIRIRSPLDKESPIAALTKNIVLMISKNNSKNILLNILLIVISLLNCTLTICISCMRGGARRALQAA